MVISYNLKSILQLMVRIYSNSIAARILDLEHTTSPYLNGVGYLSLAISDPKKLGYITKERNSNFILSRKELRFYLDGLVGNETKHDPMCELFFIKTKEYLPIKKVEYSLENDKIPFYIVGSRGRGFTISDFTSSVHLCNEFRIKHAYMVKVGKAINKLFPNEYHNRDLELFTSQYNALVEQHIKGVSGYEYELAEKDRLIKFYSVISYEKESGSLGSSCMRNPAKKDMFDLYTNNEVKLLVLRTIFGDVIRARALVWDNVDIYSDEKYKKSLGQVTLLDRIYTIDENDIQKFQLHAKEKGWAYKKYQDASNKTAIQLPDHMQSLQRDQIYARKYLNLYDIEKFPYLDTFRYAAASKEFISNSAHECNYELTAYDSGHIDGLSNSRFGEVYSTWHGKNILQKDAEYCTYIESWVLKSDLVMTVDGTVVPREHNNIIPYDSKFYFKNVCFFSSKQNMWIPKELVSNLTKVFNIKGTRVQLIEDIFSEEELAEEYVSGFAFYLDCKLRKKDTTEIFFTNGTSTRILTIHIHPTKQYFKDLFSFFGLQVDFSYKYGPHKATGKKSEEIKEVQEVKVLTEEDQYAEYGHFRDMLMEEVARVSPNRSNDLHDVRSTFETTEVPNISPEVTITSSSPSILPDSSLTVNVSINTVSPNYETEDLF